MFKLSKKGLKAESKNVEKSGSKLAGTGYLMFFLFLLLTAALVAGSLAVSAWKNSAQTLAGGLPSGEAGEVINMSIEFSAEIIELTTDSGQNYFVNYRIKREQFRQETKEMLSLLLKSNIAETRAEAAERWLELSNKIAREGELENVLKMKGFKDVVAEVNTGKINITILAEELTFEELYQVTRITADITGFPAERIEVASRA